METSSERVLLINFRQLMSTVKQRQHTWILLKTTHFFNNSCDIHFSFDFLSKIKYSTILLFVGTPRKFITAKRSICKPRFSSVLTICDLFNRIYVLNKSYIYMNWTSHILLSLMKIRTYGSEALQ
jgi:hypothetical protein